MKRIQDAWGILGGLLRPALLVLVAVTASGLVAETGAAAGVEWLPISIDEAIAQARAKDTMVMVDVWDSHCGACAQLDTDVWDTPDGVAIAEGLIPIKVQSTVDVGKAFMKLYPVTGLPAIIFIKPDGTELDRVEGYFGNRMVFLDATRPLRNGLDPLSMMEKKLQARPDSLPLLLSVMEKYLFRKREADAQLIFKRIQKLDPQNAQMMAERSMGMMARFEENWKIDYMKAFDYYKQIVERFPGSPSAGGNADAAFKALYRANRSAEWKDWICPLLEKNPTMGSLQRSATMTASLWSQRGDCFAKAARRAAKASTGKQVAWFDSIAVVMEGGTAPPRR